MIQRCSDANVFPYLCEDNTGETMCTYDHLSKVCHHNQALEFIVSCFVYREFVLVIIMVLMAVLCF